MNTIEILQSCYTSKSPFFLILRTSKSANPKKRPYHKFFFQKILIRKSRFPRNEKVGIKRDVPKVLTYPLFILRYFPNEILRKFFKFKFGNILGFLRNKILFIYKF
jgi:hypothetical protein